MLSGFPKIDLLGGATPLEHMGRIGAHIRHPQLWVKRDDCMPLAFGGNKVRSLEYWLGEALARESDILVVAGARASNQCRLTAAAAAKLGLDCLVLYAGDDTQPMHGNAMLAELMGADIRSLGPVDEEERGGLARLAVAELAAAGRRPYLIGDPIIGALGYVSAARELSGQASAQGLDLRHIVLPGSMGVTEAGMIFGAALFNLPWTFHLISVEYDADTLRDRLGIVLKGLARITNVDARADWLDRVRIDLSQLGEGYGIPTQASLQAGLIFARHEALVLEQTYVAKTFAGFLHRVTYGDIPSDEGACILHTGGTPSIFEPR